MIIIFNTFKNKVAIVTGATSGIGKCLSQELARKGAIVIVTSRSLKKTKKIAEQINKLGLKGKAFYDILDVTKEKDFKKVISKTLKKFKRIDYFFNNAGIHMYAELRDITPKDWKKVMDTNLWGCINGTHAIYPTMIKQGFGHIINLSSLDGVLPMPISAVYATTKHAIVGLTTSLRLEAAGLGIKASVVCPGYINTDIYKKANVINYKRDVMIPKGFKFMSPEKAAKIILFEVRKNKAVIIPSRFREKIFHWLYQHFPELYNHVVIMMLRKVRKQFRKK